MSNKKHRRRILAIAAQFVVLLFGVGFAVQFHRDVTDARNTGFMAVGMIAALGVTANLTMWTESRRRKARRIGHQAIIRGRAAILEGLARLAMTQDADALARIDRVCRYAAILARRLAERDPNVDADVICSVALASLLHEIGNATIDDPVTANPRPVTAAQTQLMQRLDVRVRDSTKRLGHQLESDSFVELASSVARSRNERRDGQGIPIASRILALANLYDSLTAKLPRNDNLSHAEATSIVIEGTGIQLEPRVVEAFLANHKQFETIAHSLPSRHADDEQVAVVALFNDDTAELPCQQDSVSG